MPTALAKDVVIAILVGMLAGHPTLAQDAQVEAQMRAGLQALQEGRSQDAVKAFTQVTKLGPAIAEGHMDLGLALMRVGRRDEAIVAFNSALKLKPMLAGPNLFLGILYFGIHQMDKARAAINQELKLNPRSPEALLLAGTVALEMDDPENAIGPLDRAVEISPTDLELLDMRGRAHMMVAKKSYEKMFELAPNSWQVHRVRARLFAEDGLHKDAISEYNAAIQIEPNQKDLYEDLGLEYHKSNQLDMAEKTYEAELKLNPGDMGAAFNLGSIRVERGNSAGALALLERVVNADPSRVDAFYFLGRGLADAGREGEAISAFEKVTGLASGGEMAEQSYYNLARLYRKAQRPQDSQNAMLAYQKLKTERDKQGAQTVEKFRETK